MGLYEVPLSMSLLGFGMGTMLANFHICGIMLVLRAVFNILVRNVFVRCSVGVSVCLVCCVFDSVCELFGETIRNVFESGFYFIAECACCVCDPGVHLSVPSIGFVCVFVCRNLSAHLRV